MKQKQVWTKGVGLGEETVFNGFLISRVTCQSGTKLYWVHWIENPTWAAPHNRMSIAPHRSLQSAKAMVGYLESMPERYFNPTTAKLARQIENTKEAL